jgi:hypothetical protein
MATASTRPRRAAAQNVTYWHVAALDALCWLAIAGLWCRCARGADSRAHMYSEIDEDDPEVEPEDDETFVDASPAKTVELISGIADEPVSEVDRLRAELAAVKAREAALKRRLASTRVKEAPCWR